MVRRLFLGVPLLAFWCATLLALGTVLASRVDAGAYVPVRWAALAAQVTGLTQLTGAGSATDDDFVVYDTSASAIKRIARSELASVVGSWTTVLKTSNETISSDNTPNSDSTLSLSVSANTKYRIRMVVFYSTNSTPGFKWGFTGPSSPTLLIGQYSPATNGLTAAFYDTYPAYVEHLGSAEPGRYGMPIDICLHNGSNAGTLAFVWSQSNSNASNTTVHAGSYIEYAVVP